MDPTPVQLQAIPIFMERRDLIVSAPTGSGKSLSFLLPLFALIERGRRSKKLAALILVPTKELAIQLHHQAVMLAKFRGSDEITVATLNAGINTTSEILIATPMLLIKALGRKRLSLKSLRFLVFDEADRLLDRGFLEQADHIIEKCPRKAQKALFSATISSGVEALAAAFTTDPIRIVIGVKGGACKDVEQSLMFVGKDDAGKFLVLRQLLRTGGSLPSPGIIFIREKSSMSAVVDCVAEAGRSAVCMSSDDDFNKRNGSLQAFHRGHASYLVATDLLARGIDFQGVESVLNFDCPETAATYIHRIGRTGRAGSRGKAVTFFSEKDGDCLRTIANVMRDAGCQVPDWILTLPKIKHRDIRKRRISEAHGDLPTKKKPLKKKPTPKQQKKPESPGAPIGSDEEICSDSA